MLRDDPDPSPASPEGGRTALRVLLVEDSAADARLVTEHLRDHHPRRFEVTHVAELAEALAMIESAPFDAIVLDLSLPDSSGAETVFEVQRTVPTVPVVVLSGHDDDELGMALVEAGAQDYLVKGQVDAQRIGRTLRYAIQRKRAEERLRKLAQHDSLTGLANRTLFEDRLEQAIARARRHRSSLALMFLDLDRFKTVNDTLGHDVGDELLRSIARVLVECVRESDTVARLGGDEFTMILEGVHDARAAAGAARKVIGALERPFRVRGHEIFITTSIGIAVFPHSGVDAATLTRSADSAMYLAKESGRNVYRFYSADMDEEALGRLEREVSLRRALERGELTLHYQPQVELATGRISGMEALLRWLPPGAGEPVLPAEFVPFAEESGLIVPIGTWVLREACAQHRQWRAAGMAPFRMSVNLSARQIEDPRFLATVDEALAETGMDSAALELELTETMLMRNPEATGGVLAELKRRGIGISVDDFGTGYCSLSNLRHLPVDALKIDQSFVRNIDDPVDGAIAQAIVGLARRLGLRVVAEGVENAQQLAALRVLDPDEVQGFFVSRPQSAASVETLMRLAG